VAPPPDAIANVVGIGSSIRGTTAIVASAIALGACGGHAARDTTAGSAVAGSTSADTATSGAALGRSESGARSDGDWSRFDYDAQRSGVGPRETGITAADLGQLRRRVVHIDGVADSSAVQLHDVKVRGRKRDVAILTTTYGRTIAIDPGTGAKLWEFAPPDIGAYEGSGQITTATPVADPDRRYVYAAGPDGLIRKLRIANGREARSGHWPARITFDPGREKIGGALNLNGREVIAVTGGYYGDAPVYQGHVVLIDRGTGRIADVWNSLCSDRHYLLDPPRSCHASDSAIWARSGAVIEPSTGRILVATGNAPFNGSSDWGDSVLELTPDASRLVRNWTPANQAQLDANDLDLGSTAPALLPPVHGLRLAVQGGKEGILYLLDLNRLDGTPDGASARVGGELQRISAPGGGAVLTAPSVWSHGGKTYVFVANDNSTAAYVLGAGGQPRLSVAWQKSAAGSSPIVAGGLLYVYDVEAGRLDIRKPGSGQLLESLPAGGGHWSSPIVIGGRIVLPVGGSTADDATSGIVNIYHLPGR
jgi:PQQ-like domain